MNRFPSCASRLALKSAGAPLLVLAACVGGCHQDVAAPPPPPGVATAPASPMTIPPAVPAIPSPPSLPKKPPVKVAALPPPVKMVPIRHAAALPRTTPKPTPAAHPAPAVRPSPAVAARPRQVAAPRADVKVAAAPPVALSTPIEALTNDPNALFQAVRERVPGQMLSVVYVKGGKGALVRLLELPETPGAAAPPAAEVARALQAAIVEDPLLADHLVVTEQAGGAALALPNAPRPLLVVDQSAADEQGLSPAQAAQGIIQAIRENVGPQQRDLVAVPSVTTPEAQMTPEQKLQRAQELRRLGDDAYVGKDRHRAEVCYHEALALAPAYSVPFLRLAGLYHEEKQDDRARAILRQALQADGLSPRQKQTILARQAGLKS